MRSYELKLHISIIPVWKHRWVTNNQYCFIHIIYTVLSLSSIIIKTLIHTTQNIQRVILIVKA